MITHRFYKDHLGYLLEYSRPYDKDPDDNRGDSAGNTAQAGIVYGQPFIHTIAKHFEDFLDGGPWAPIRHPEDPREEDFSRDHTVWFVIWMRYFYPEYLKEALRIPKKISKEARRGLHIFLWIRALNNRPGYNLLHWLVAGLWLRGAKWWNNYLFRRAGLETYDYKVFKSIPDDKLLPIDKKAWQARKWSLPSYSIHTLAWQIKCLKPGWFKNRLKKRVLKLAEKENWLIRMLMDDVFSSAEKEKIEMYTGMDAYRWARRMDRTCDIEINALQGPQPPYNMDVDVLHINLDWE